MLLVWYPFTGGYQVVELLLDSIKLGIIATPGACIGATTFIYLYLRYIA